jgi:hypothetical protein
MKKGYLPKKLSYKTCNDLIRLGGKNDGGYLVSKSDIDRTKFLLSFGINDDWKFEKDFALINPIPVRAYDATTNFKLFLKRSLGAIFRLNFIEAFTKPFQYLSLKNFFSKENKIIKKFVGINDGDIHISMREVFKDLNQNDIFIKMDIEGSEYRCLEDIVKNQFKISGAVIEFHDVDLNLDKIIDFVEKFDLAIAHIHANNYFPVSESNIPLILEITFSKNGIFLDRNPILPHQLDKPNNNDDIEIEISF